MNNINVEQIREKMKLAYKNGINNLNEDDFQKVQELEKEIEIIEKENNKIEKEYREFIDNKENFINDFANKKIKKYILFTILFCGLTITSASVTSLKSVLIYNIVITGIHGISTFIRVKLLNQKATNQFNIKCKNYMTAVLNNDEKKYELSKQIGDIIKRNVENNRTASNSLQVKEEINNYENKNHVEEFSTNISLAQTSKQEIAKPKTKALIKNTQRGVEK